MYIINVSGVGIEKSRVWHNMSAAFADEFPGATFTTKESLFAMPNDVFSWPLLTSEIMRECDRPDDVLIVGHSLGGLVAILASLMLEAQENVRGIVTIFSPHQLAAFIPWMTGFHAMRPQAPLVTFGGVNDGIIDSRLAKHRHSTFHMDLLSDHMSDLVRNPTIARTIASVTKQHVFS